MKWTGRLRGDAASSVPSDDVIAWETLCQSVIAAHEGHPRPHTSPILRMEPNVRAASIVGFYVRFLLRYRVAEMLGRRPIAEDLRDLAERYYPRFAEVIRGDPSLFEAVLLTACGLAEEGGRIVGGEAIVLGTAALGVLLDDPSGWLPALQLRVADSWQRNEKALDRALRER